LSEVSEAIVDQATFIMGLYCGYAGSTGVRTNLFFQMAAQGYERDSMILVSNFTFGSWDTAFAGLRRAHLL
jgi:hypothetical protein